MNTYQYRHTHKRPNTACNDVLRTTYDHVPERCKLLNASQEACEPWAKAPTSRLPTAVHLRGETNDFGAIRGSTKRLRSPIPELRLLFTHETGFELRDGFSEPNLGFQPRGIRDDKTRHNG